MPRPTWDNADDKREADTISQSEFTAEDTNEPPPAGPSGGDEANQICNACGNECSQELQCLCRKVRGQATTCESGCREKVVANDRHSYIHYANEPLSKRTDPEIRTLADLLGLKHVYLVILDKDEQNEIEFFGHVDLPFCSACDGTGYISKAGRIAPRYRERLDDGTQVKRRMPPIPYSIEKYEKDLASGLVCTGEFLSSDFSDLPYSLIGNGNCGDLANSLLATFSMHRPASAAVNGDLGIGSGFGYTKSAQMRPVAYAPFGKCMDPNRTRLWCGKDKAGHAIERPLKDWMNIGAGSCTINSCLDSIRHDGNTINWQKFNGLVQSARFGQRTCCEAEGEAAVPDKYLEKCECAPGAEQVNNKCKCKDGYYWDKYRMICVPNHAHVECGCGAYELQICQLMNDRHHFLRNDCTHLAGDEDGCLLDVFDNFCEICEPCKEQLKLDGRIYEMMKGCADYNETCESSSGQSSSLSSSADSSSSESADSSGGSSGGIGNTGGSEVGEDPCAEQDSNVGYAYRQSASCTNRSSNSAGGSNGSNSSQQFSLPGSIDIIIGSAEHASTSQRSSADSNSSNERSSAPSSSSSSSRSSSSSSSSSSTSSLCPDGSTVVPADQRDQCKTCDDCAEVCAGLVCPPENPDCVTSCTLADSGALCCSVIETPF